MTTKKIALFILIGAFYFTVSFSFLLQYPPVWPDESEYADIAYNLKTENRLYRKLFVLPDPSKSGVYFYPPFLFYFYAGIYKIFGFSIGATRIFAVIAGFLSLLIVYLLANRYTKNFLLGSVPVLLLVLDMTFMRASRFSRPEIFILTLFLGIFYLLVSFDKKWIYILAGILATLAFLIQPMGILGTAIAGIFLLVRYRSKAASKIILFSLPVLLGLLWWFKVIDFQLINLFNGMKNQFARRGTEPSYFSQLQSNGGWYQLLYLSLLAGSVLATIYLIIKPVKNKLLLILFLIFLWLFVIVGKEFWYFPYPLPFLYLAYAVAIGSEISSPRKSFVFNIFFTVLICGNILGNVILNSAYLQPFTIEKPSYELFGQSVKKIIPDGSKVMISCIPDPYFILKQNDTLDLRIFFSGVGLKKEYLAALNDMDYIVYSSSLDYVYGNLMNNYIKKNMKQAFLVNNGPYQYKAVVFKLKPKTERNIDNL